MSEHDSKNKELYRAVNQLRNELTAPLWGVRAFKDRVERPGCIKIIVDES